MKKDRRLHHPVAIANYFIQLGKQDKVAISLLKLIKLVYIAHGWHLALYETPLLDEAIEAWTYGPMVPSVYHTFKGKGERIKEIEKVMDEKEPKKWILPPLDEKNETLIGLLKAVWGGYKAFSDEELSLLGHRQGTAWQQLRDGYVGHPLRNLHLPNASIQAEFQKIAKKGYERK